MNSHLKTCAAKVLSATLIGAMTASFVPSILGQDSVEASEILNADNTGLCTSLIGNPKAPSSKDDPWSGSYVYYGKINDHPIKFRVLSNNETKFGGSTLFIESDSAITYKYFDGDDDSSWKNSSIRAYLNNDFIASDLTGIEADALIKSTISSHAFTTDPAKGVPVSDSVIKQYVEYTPLYDDKVFLMDAEDISNPKYGYYIECGLNQTKITYARVEKWLRNLVISYDDFSLNACYDSSGFKSINTGYSKDIVPAMNVDRSSILFSTCIDSDKDEYQLTLIDRNMNISVPSDGKVSVSGKTVSIPYCVNGSNASELTNVYVLILDKTYTAKNTNNASVLYLKSIANGSSQTGTGVFELPGSLDLSGWGSDYYVYTVAFSGESDSYTSYASKPMQVSLSGNSKNGWFYSEGERYYYINGSYQTGWKMIDGYYYYFDNNGVMLTGVQEVSGKKYYMDSDGVMVRDSLITANYRTYYFGNDGAAIKGWKLISGDYYYFKNDYTAANNCELTINGKRYYFDEDGKMFIGQLDIPHSTLIYGDDGALKCIVYSSGGERLFCNPDDSEYNGWIFYGESWRYIESGKTCAPGWKRIGGAWYYFLEDNHKTSKMALFDITVDGKQYYLGNDGRMRTGWVNKYSSWYYYTSDGSAISDGFHDIGGKTYYFEGGWMFTSGFAEDGYTLYYIDSNGHVTHGWIDVSILYYVESWCYADSTGVLVRGWQKIGGVWYYFCPDLAETPIMQTGWLDDSGVKYYLRSNGAMATGWEKIDGEWYYFNSDGSMATGWVKINNIWYYFRSSGEMVTSWQKIGGVWYYFENNGSLVTGWKLLGGVWYYFDANGSMVTGSKTINGKTYYFDESGHCTNP